MNMALSIVLTVLAAILLILGFLGTFVPVLPGAPLAWVGLLLCFLSSINEISFVCLAITFVVAVVVSILDNFLPVIMTDKLGGSKAATIGSTIGLIIGFFIALCNLSKNKGLKLFGKVYTDIIRGTPSVTQLMIIYFVVFGSVHWAKWIIAAIAFAINSGAYVSEIIRAGILSIDKGQTEAGRSLGLSRSQTMVNIIIPQATKNIFPALCNEFITLIKETAIVGYVGLMDIQKAGDFIKSATYKPILPLLATAVIYFVIIKILTVLLGKVEKRLRKADNR